MRTAYFSRNGSESQRHLSIRYHRRPLEVCGALRRQCRGLAKLAQNLRLFFRQAKGTVTADLRDAFMWERVQEIANKGPFNRLVFIDAPAKDATLLEQIFGEVDESTSNRLVVLDARRWALLNGRDTSTRSDIEALLGTGPMGLHVDNAASVVVACVNTQRRETAPSVPSMLSPTVPRASSSTPRTSSGPRPTTSSGHSASASTTTCAAPSSTMRTWGLWASPRRADT